MSNDSMLGAVKGYYTDKVKLHGATPKGVDWNGVDSQEARFEQLLDIIPANHVGCSLNDYGCGYGALLEPLIRRCDDFEYQGYDLSEAMVQAARESWAAEPRARFTDSLDELAKADFTVASGIFNVKLQAGNVEWQRYIYETLDRMVELSVRGIAFNALTSHSDPDRKRNELFYADPSTLLHHCLSRYSRDVELRHNYGLYEFTLLVQLDGRPPAAPAPGGPP